MYSINLCMYRSKVNSLLSSSFDWPTAATFLKSKSFQTTKINSSMEKSAGVIIIGDEILKGQTQDTNSLYICQKLYRFGIRVKKISVIGDDLELISSEIRKFSSSYDFVLTSGGIGPTHDDMTFEGVAKAFDEPLISHPTLKELCLKFFGPKSIDSPEMKLALIPSSSALHFGIDTVKGEPFKFPLVSVKNVFIFPGIPVLLRRLIDHLGHLFSTDETFHSETLLINATETNIAAVLKEGANKFKDVGVTIGSYPDWSNNYYKVKVIIESVNKDATRAATSFLMSNLEKSYLVDSFIDNPVALKGEDVYGDKIKRNFPLLFQKVMRSTQILEEAFRKYPDDAISIGFNGGKDCTALLHLFYAVACRLYPGTKKKFQVIYIKDKHPFEELEGFMLESFERYDVKSITLEGDMKSAMMQLHKENPNIKAVVMGTRCTDPYSKNLTEFTPTDPGWPPFMRVNPILNWTYHDIWTFIRTLYLPYCVLYDRGYTSLGSRENTSRNEKLVTTDTFGNLQYAPAYTLKDQDFERNGRL